jgi:hypothetical protein
LYTTANEPKFNEACGINVARYPDPEETLNKFAIGLARTIHADGWVVACVAQRQSNRKFLLVKPRADGEDRIEFFAKLSQTERGFWGLLSERAHELTISTTEHLVLLTGPFEGYFIKAGRLARLLPTFSKDQSGQYKINEGKLPQDGRFVTLVRLWEFLR